MPISLCLRAAGLLAAGALLACAGRRDAPSGACAIESTLALSRDPREAPVALAHRARDLVALVAHAAPSGVTARALVVRPGRAPAVAATAAAPTPGALAGFVPTPDGPAFAVATREGVTATVLREGAPRVVRFPRGEQPAARAPLAPALALAAGPGGALAALTRYARPHGVHRVHARTVYESAGYTPARRDVFAAPDVAVVGDEAVVVQERRVGAYATPSPERRREVELVALPASPWRAPDVRPLVIARDARAPRVAPREGAVLVAWRDARGVAVTEASPSPAGWRAGRTTRAAGDDRVVAHDVAALPGPCGALAVWLADGALVAQALGEGAAPARVALGVGGRPRVLVERAGARAVVAADGGAGLRLFEARADARCAVTVRPVALPARMAGLRLAGLASDGARVVVAGTRSARAHATVVLASVGARATVTAARRVAADVRDVALARGGAVILAGRGARGVHLERWAPGGDDVADLDVRGSRGADVALAASPAHGRVWVADALDAPRDDLGPAQSVVLHSFVEELEDGPRTETRTGVVPAADFAGLTLDRASLRGRAAWAATWSAAPRGEGCVPGAWAALYDQDTDAPLALGARGTSPWPHALALVPSPEARCGDRVHDVAWAGPRFAAVVAGEAFGARLVTGDVDRGEARSTPLGARGVTAAGTADDGARRAVAWLDGAAVRLRTFGRDGAAPGPVVTVAAGAGATPWARLPVLAAGGGRFAVAFPSPTGPRVARVRCAP